jgi:hypothetical protein
MSWGSDHAESLKEMLVGLTLTDVTYVTYSSESGEESFIRFRFGHIFYEFHESW